MPKFEVFTSRSVPPAAVPQVTVHKRGTISLNRAAFAALGQPRQVELLYDPVDHVIGLRPASAGTTHAYPVRSAGTERGPFLVSAIAFTKHYRIKGDRSLRWPAEVIEGVLCVELDEPGTPVTSNRARTAAPDSRP